MHQLCLISLIFSSICVSVVRLACPSLQSQKKSKSSDNEFSNPHKNEPLEGKPKPFFYGMDPSDTKRLALLELHLAASLSKVRDTVLTAGKDDLCLTYLQKYLWDFNLDDRAVQGKGGIYRANIVADNPNLSFRLLRRTVVTLLDNTVSLCKNSVPHVESIINDTFTALDMTPPNLLDLEDAFSGLLRIHFVYGFKATTEIRLGIFNGTDTKAQLYFDDCLALGLKAIEYDAETLAYQWLQAAAIRLAEMQREFESTGKETKDLLNAWLDLQELENVESLAALHERPHKKQRKINSVLFDYDYYAVCRGESDQSLTYQSQLRCFYQHDWDPYFSINPVKTEALSAKPLIYQFYDFAGSQTLDYIRNSVTKKLTYYGYNGTNRGKERAVIPIRSSINSWYLNQHHPIMVKLNKRVEALTGLKMPIDATQQNLLAARYGPLGGHYDFHIDALQNSTYNIEKEGDRVATFLMFLSDVKMGGYTGFPLAGAFAKPEKGSALFWYNTKLNGDIDGLSYHGGCPVILGTKDIINRWIYQYENMFQEPCSLDPTE